MGQKWERSLAGWSWHGNLSWGCSQEISQSYSLWRLEDLIPRWLMHMVDKLILAIGRKSQFFPIWTPSQSDLTVLMTWQWASPRASTQRKSKKEAAIPFMTKPWKSTLVLRCSIGYTDQLYSRQKGLHWGMCVRRQQSLGPSWGPVTTFTLIVLLLGVFFPQISAQLILSFLPDIYSKVTLLERLSLNFLSEWNPSHHSLSPLMLFYFSLLHLEHLTCYILLYR